MDSNENTVKSYASSPQSLISFMEKSNDYWHVKDEQLRTIYINDTWKDVLNIPRKFDLEGKTDKEFPCAPCQELWEEFAEYDRKVMAEDKTISSVVIHYYGKGNFDHPTPILADKTPFYDEKNTIGTITRIQIIDAPTLLFYMHRFNRKTIQFDTPNDIFTKRELDIIFWALQRLSSKEIARRLDLSPRTIETRLQTIYQKASVYSKCQLIEYCEHTGLDTYIPADFVRNGIQLFE